MTQDILRDDRFLCRSCGRPNQWTPKPPRFSWFEVLAVAGMFLFIGGMLQKWEAGRNIYEYHKVKVLQKFDDFHFRMAKADGEFTAHFCTDYKPDLVEGCFLTTLRYQDKGTCWSVAAPDLGYWYEHNDEGDDINERGQICYSERQDDAR